MRDRIQLQPALAVATCARLPGRESNLVRREMASASGGIGLPPIGPYPMSRWIVMKVAEAIADYFDD